MGPQVVALIVLLLVTALLGLVWRSRQGRLRPHAVSDATADWAPRLSDLGVGPGSRATFVQFSAPVCTPCRATSRVLSALAAGEPGVVHTEIDVEEHPDLARESRVLRAPTVLVLDATGAEVVRASGAMTPAQARRALELATGTVSTRTVDAGRNA